MDDRSDWRLVKRTFKLDSAQYTTVGDLDDNMESIIADLEDFKGTFLNVVGVDFPRSRKESHRCAHRVPSSISQSLDFDFHEGEHMYGNRDKKEDVADFTFGAAPDSFSSEVSSYWGKPCTVHQGSRRRRETAMETCMSSKSSDWQPPRR